jgi:precorrin-6B methylase 2
MPARAISHVKLSEFSGEKLVQQYESIVNPVIEVSINKGKYVLNSASVNFSYGLMHEVFRSYFRQDPPGLMPDDKALILGFGGGTIAVILLEELGLKCSITGVELDEAVIKAARDHFNIQRLQKLEILQQDAMDFVNACNEKYKLIVVDIYVDNALPPQFEEESFFRRLRNCLEPGGKIVFNKFASSNAQMSEAIAIESLFKNHLNDVKTFRIPVNKKAPNLIIVGRG